MASILKVNTIQDTDGNNIINENANVITIGASGDTITVPAGATVSGFTSAGIDDNATSVAITIDSNENVGIGTTSPNNYSGYGNLTLNGTSGGIFDLEVNGTRTGSLLGLVGETRLASITNIPVTFQVNNAEKMRLNSTGLGIGTSNPSEKLEIAGTGTQTLKIDRTDASTAGAITINSANDSNYIYNLTSKNLVFGTNNNARMTIDGSGNVGIGTSSPITPLNVIGGSDLGIEVSDTSSGGNGVITIKGNATNGGSYLQFGDTDDDNVGRVYYTHNDNAMKFNTADAERMRIDSSGLVRIGNTSSTGHGSTYNLIVGNESSGGDAGVLVVTPNNENSYFGFGDSGGTPGSINYNHGSNFMRFYVNSAERMRISNNGYIGIGTPTTTYALNISNSAGEMRIKTTDGQNVANATTSILEFHGTDNRAGYVGFVGGDMVIHTDTYSAGDIKLQTNGAERMRIDNVGNLKVSRNGAAFNVNSTHQLIDNLANSYSLMLSNKSSSPASQYMLEIGFKSSSPDNGNAKFIEANDSTTTRFRVSSDGDVYNHDGTYGTISDERIKQDIIDASSQWEDIKNIRVRKYKKKDDVLQYGEENAPTEIGVISQELETVSPGLIKEQKPNSSHAELHEDFAGENPQNVKYVKYSILYMKSIKALQEAMERIEQLETKNTELEARITALETNNP